MLPEKQDDENAVDDETDGHSPHDRVQNWAKAVSSASLDGQGPDEVGAALVEEEEEEEEDRQSRFDRPLKDVRVGESPSRPWGITVPVRFRDGVDGSKEDVEIVSADSVPTASPLDTPQIGQSSREPSKGKCPFGHSADLTNPHIEPEGNARQQVAATAWQEPSISSIQPRMKEAGRTSQSTGNRQQRPVQQHSQPVVFDTKPTVSPAPIAQTAGTANPEPRMVFTGPVFIGYPMEQALALLKESGYGGAKT